MTPPRVQAGYATGPEPTYGDHIGSLLSGHWLAARAPHFHNGSAATLKDVVNFYGRRFSIGLSAQDEVDLVNFMNSL